ncbi:MAG: hypothetical protein V1809_08700 [Planctomycetota bacterium]
MTGCWMRFWANPDDGKDDFEKHVADRTDKTDRTYERGKTMTDPIPDVIGAKHCYLMDSSGETRATIVLQSNGPYLAFPDEQGQVRFCLMLSSEDLPHVGFYDENGNIHCMVRMGAKGDAEVFLVGDETNALARKRANHE